MAIDPVRALRLAADKWYEDAVAALQKNRVEVTLGLEAVIINRRIEYIDAPIKPRVRPMTG